MTYDWTQLDINEITNLYLYGKLTTPGDLTSSSLIPLTAKDDIGATIDVDMSSYMTTGPGRFATGSQSALVQAFFSDATDLSWAVGMSYSKQDFVDQLLLHGIDVGYFGISIKQINFDDSSGDYLQRAYIWNSGAFMLADNVSFVIDANGTRSIQNYAIVPDERDLGKPENFDFKGGSTIAGFANDYLEPRIDPWGIGRTVNINFVGDVPPRTYTENNYISDAANTLVYSVVGAHSILTLPFGGVTITGQLWDNGITQFLDSENRPIRYGTTGSDTLSADFSESQAPLLFPYKSNGVRLIGGAGNDTLIGGSKNDYLDGGDNDDTLTGGGGQDTLNGGKGADKLEGGAGNDTLLGGIGNDTYQYTDGGNNTDGFDIIFDRDGNGSIKIDGVTLAGGAQYGDERVHRDADGRLYVKVGLGLVVDGAMLVQGYQTGNLGLNMSTLPPAEPTSILTIAGDLEVIDFDPAAAGIQFEVDDLGNKKVDASKPIPDQADRLMGSNGNDTIIGLGGRDLLYGQAGDDHIYGGGDVDLIDGGQGDDYLYADTQIPTAIAIAQGNEQIGGGETGDWINGGTGNDTLVGNNANNFLAGGAGDDLLIGGAGNDVLLGDHYTIPPPAFPAETWITSSGSGITYAQPWYYDTVSQDLILVGVEDNHPPLPNTSGNDVIYAGAGNDVAFGGYGDDVIFGEGDNDILQGNSGNDILIGGAGNDYLYGDLYENYSTPPIPGNDYLEGGDGGDFIYGNEGDDILIGGAGADTIYGGAGKDVYIYNKGDGADFVSDSNTEGNILRFGAGISSSDITLRLGSLMLDLGNGDEIHIEGFNQNDMLNSSVIDSFEFADGSVLSTRELLARGFDLNGSEGDDILIGTYTADRMQGFAGNDSLQGGDGSDYLSGGAGDDELYGNIADDVLIGGLGIDVLDGGLGDDTLQGDEGNDVYHFNIRMGRDTAIDASAGGNTIKLAYGIVLGQLKATQSGNDLLLVRNESNGMTIKDYFLTPQNWVVTDVNGNSQSMADMLETTANSAQDEFSVLRDRFFAEQEVRLLNDYPEYHAVGNIVTKDTWQTTTTNTTSYGWNSGGGGSFANTSVNIISSYLTGYNFGSYQYLSLLETQNVIHRTEVGSDAPTILVDAGQVTSFSLQAANAVVNWGAPYNPYNSGILYSMGISVGNIYDNRKSVIGTSTNVRERWDEFYLQDGIVQAITSIGGDPAMLKTRTETFNFQEIIGGVSDNQIWASSNPYAVVNGGAGNDAIYGGGLSYGGDGDDYLSNAKYQYGGNGNDGLMYGDILNGGAGNDTLVGGYVLVGGMGDDTMDGGSYGTGESRYVIDPTQTGVDLISDTGDSEFAYKSWYYNSLGIPNWQESEWLGDKWVLWYGEGGAYETLDEVRTFFDLRGDPYDLDAMIADGNLYYVPPLPTVTMPAANNYAALQSAYNAGVIAMDTVDFGAGITLADLNFSWGQDNGRPMLDLSWNNGISQVRLAIPNADDPLGYGIEQFLFADGTILSMAEMMSFAPPPPSFNPIELTIFQSNLGSGVQVVDNASINTIEFGAGITPDMLSLGLGSLLIRVGSGGDEIHITNFDPNDARSSHVQTYIFADGTVLTHGELVTRGFDLVGNELGEIITGTNVTDRIAGQGGDDLLQGGAGNDRYVFRLGDGTDTIVDALGSDTLFIGSGLTEINLEGIRDGDNMIVTVLGTTDSITLTNWFIQSEGVNRIEFSDGTWLDHAGIGELLNRPPVANSDAVTVTEDSSISAIAVAGLLANDTDPDAGDILSVIGFDTVTAQGNVVTQDFMGDLVLDIGSSYQALGAGQTAIDSFTYTISDSAGAISSAAVNITIEGVNDAPVNTISIGYQQAIEDAPFSFTVPAGTFTDIDNGDVLIYSATLADGTALPIWLSFDAATQTFIGTPLNENVGNLSVRVSATDTGGLSASSTFALSVINVNDAPIANADVGAATEDGGTVTFTAATLLANDTDPDFIHGDVLNIVSVSQASSGALVTLVPSAILWQPGDVQYDIGNHFQSLGAGQTTTDAFSYTIADSAGAMSTANVVMTVTGVNDAPVTAIPLANQQTNEDALFSFTIPTGTFTDIDHGDVLSYAATLLDGTALPAWLTFDAITQTFSGTPVNEDVGNLNVRVTATDTGGLSASSTFALSVINVNDAPIANADVGAATEDGGTVTFTAATLLANDTDPDFIHGDVLNIVSVTQTASGAIVTLINGNVQYDPSTSSGQGVALYQSLAQGQTTTDTFSYTVADTAGAISAAKVTMTITGTNDGPVAVADINLVREDLVLSASGNVLANDSDVDQGTVLTVVNAGTLLGNYGSLVLNADGSYSYALDNASLAVQSLAAGQTVTEAFGYQVTDGLIATPSNLTVTIAGSNDAPLLVNALTDQIIHTGAVYSYSNYYNFLDAINAFGDFVSAINKQNTAFSYQVPADAFADIDSGDSLVYSATLSNGTALPSWLAFDPLSRSFSGTASIGSPSNIDIQVIATDIVGATASDVFRLSLGATINGGANFDILVGTSFDDTLNGGLSWDLMAGGSGNDTYVVDNAYDVVIEFANDGIDHGAKHGHLHSGLERRKPHTHWHCRHQRHGQCAQQHHRRQ